VPLNRRTGWRSRLLRHPARVVVVGFVVAILVGTALLEIPVASTQNGSAPLLTCLFTATSAVTVTGLTPVDPATFWTPFCQAVILGLIQIGGLGIMTARRSCCDRLQAHRSARPTGHPDRDQHPAPRRPAPPRVTIVVFTAPFEVLATIVLAVRLGRGDARRLRPVGRAFHAVSAFNTPVFDLPTNLIGFASDAWVLLTIAVAVIAGGLGFPVWLDLSQRLRRPSRWSLHTKLTLVTSVALIVIGTIVLTALEWRDQATLGALSPAHRVLGGFFAAVTPRTAGFNALDYSVMDQSSLLVHRHADVHRGGAAGTAGGLKVTTLAVLFLAVWAEVRGDTEVAASRRRIPRSVLRQALTVAVITNNWWSSARCPDGDQPRAPSEAVFEVTSASRRWGSART